MGAAAVPFVPHENEMRPSEGSAANVPVYVPPRTQTISPGFSAAGWPSACCSVHGASNEPSPDPMADEDT